MSGFYGCPKCPETFQTFEVAADHIDRAHSTFITDIPVTSCTCHPASLAGSESEKFFRHLNNGEVYLNRHTETGDFRIDIIKKGLPQ